MKYTLIKIIPVIIVLLYSTLIAYSQIISPKDLPNLKVWFAADSSVIMPIDTRVSQWTDLSENNNHAIQSDNTVQPTRVLNSINGKPAIYFNGSNTFMLTPMGLLDNWNELSIFTIIKLKESKNGGLWGSDQSYVNFEFTSQTNGSIRIRNNNDAANIIYNDLLTVDDWIANTTIGTNNTGNSWKNSIKVTDSENTTQLPIGSNIQQAMGRYQIINYANFEIAEFIVYDRALTETERQNVENYLYDKYAPPVNLGPDINNSDSLCSISLDASSYFTSFLWSTGETSQTISVDSSANYWVRSTDIFGRTSRDTVSVNFPTPKVPSNTLVCEGDTKIWDTELTKSKFTFVWQDASTDSLLDVSLSNNYSVTINDMFSCSTSYSITTTTDYFSSTASLGNDTSLCAGNTIYLKSAISEADSYLWSDASSNDSLPIYVSGEYSLTVTSSNNCIKKDTINITIAGIAPTVNFTFDTACFGESNNFIDLSIPPSGNSIVSRIWDFGNLNTLDTTATNFFYEYTDTGNYDITLTITTDVGCSKSQTQQIVVPPFPLINYSTSNPTCQKQAVTFLGTASTFGYPISDWNWNFEDPSSGLLNTANLQNASHTYLNDGNYTVELIANNEYGCKDTATNIVIVKPSPISNFTSSLACINNLVQFNNSTITPPSSTVQSFSWDFDDLITSGLLNPIHAFTYDSIHMVRLITTLVNTCSDTIIKSVSVYPKPIVSFNHSNVCLNKTTQFTNHSTISTGSISSYHWDFGDNTLVNNDSNSIHIFTTSTTSLVKLKNISDQGCSDSTTQSITIYPTPTASFSANLSYGSPPLEVICTNTSEGATQFAWNLNESSIDTSQNVTTSFSTVGTYPISLISTNTFLCSDTATQVINVLEQFIDVSVENITTIIKDGYLYVSAQLKNNSSVDITSLLITLDISDINTIREELNTTILKDGLLLHNFVAVSIKDSKHFVCVSTDQPNEEIDEIKENNQLCNAVESSTFEVLQPFPSPASSSLTLPLLVPEYGIVDIEIYNSIGEQIRNKQSLSLDKGVQLIKIYINEYNSGVYTFKVTYQDKVYSSKFIKN